MINEKEIELANSSYVKKDFYQIYPELLDLIIKYTERWDPKSSNESDPGVVLTKLAAFVADKNNYNIDKNILEDFMISCTQEESMRKLCDMMGYNMKYNQSATTYITFKYYGQAKSDDDTSEDKLKGQTLILPAFDTVVSDSEGNINYILLQQVNITLDEPEQTVLAMQGQLRTVQVGTDTTIHLNNLDDNNRLYLPLSTISENGIFIWKANDDKTYENTWRKVDNLNVEHTKNYVWKFGFDSSKSLPYIEFPADIADADLIGDGIVIKYLETLGVNGNIGANKLCKLSTDTIEITEDISIDLSGDDSSSVLYIHNASASSNGADKESLNQAYSNFNKTVGTFNTLVTCRDYSNAIYNMTDDDNTTSLIGNIQVSDIRDDLNYSDTVATYTNKGLTYKSVSKKDSSSQEDLISHFDLVLYPFGRILNNYSINNYQGTFKYFEDTLSDIYLNLQDNKTLSHSFKIPGEDDLLCIKQLYDLSARITTTYKVNNAEELEILANIFTALYKNFNSRQVEFGDAIPFDSIYDVIKNADTRIKNVSLDEPDVNSYVMTRRGNLYPLYKASDTTGRAKYLNLLSGNILAGRLHLLNYYTDIKHSYGQTKLSNYDILYNNIKKINSELIINDLSGSSYTLKKNEAIQFIAPSLATDVTYPYTVNYFLKIDRGSGASHRYEIEEDEEYQLKNNDKFYINYTSGSDDSNKVVIDILYTTDKIITYKDSTKTSEETVDFNIIKPNFLLQDSDVAHTSTSVWAKTAGSKFLESGGDLYGKGMNQFGSSQQVEHRNYVKTTLGNNTSGNTSRKCYWITADGKLFDSTSHERILKDGEYFMYTGMSDDSGMYIFGSGTKLIDNTYDGSTYAQSLFHNIQIDYSKQPSLSDINLKGLSAGINWEIIRFTSNRTLTVQEMQIKTLTEGDTLNSVTFKAGNTWPINNTQKSVTSASFTISESPDSISTTNISNFEWKVFSRLDLNMGPDTIQTLSNTSATQGLQSIVIEYGTTTPYSQKTISGTNTDATKPSILCNYQIQKAGSNSILVSGVSDMSWSIFNNSVITDRSGNEIKFGEYTTLQLSDIVPTSGTNYVYIPVIVGTNQFGMCMIYNNSTTAVTLKATDSSVTGNAILSEYNHYTNDVLDTPSATLSITSGLHIVKIDSSCKLHFEGNTSGSIVIKSFDTVKKDTTLVDDKYGVNTELLGITQTEVTEMMKNILSKYTGTFFYNIPANNDMLIDTDDMTDVNVWYDYNNRYNKFVISEINSDTLSDGISLTKSSRI